ncbi:MAG: FtsX-like permease family protein [Pseudomonadota bacterium]
MNRLRLVLDLAWRMLGLHGRSTSRFAKFVTWVSFIGLGLGVMVLTLVVTVMNGFDAELKNRLLRSIPHIKLRDGDRLPTLRAEAAQVAGVLAASDYFEGVGALATGNSQPRPLTVMGVAPEGVPGLRFVGDAMQRGEFSDLFEAADHLFLGEPIAAYLGLQVGDPVMILMIATDDGVPRPQMVRFVLAGTFEIGAEVDYSIAFANLSRYDNEAWRRLGKVGVQVQLRDALATEAALEALTGRIAVGEVVTWQEEYGELFRAVALEKSMMFVILLLVVAIASFNIIAGQSMIVEDKRSNIAILRSMGIRARAIRDVFLLQGLVISVSGTLLGMILGLLAAFNINTILDAVAALTGMHLLDGSFFVEVPVQVKPLDLVIIAAMTCTLCLLSSNLPARRAMQVDPIAALH